MRKKLLRYALLGTGLLLCATASASGPGPEDYVAPLVFTDVSGNPSLSIQLATGRGDTGQFDFYVSGVGDYVAGATLTAVSSPQVTCNGQSQAVQAYGVSYSGPATLKPVSGGATTQVTLQMGGTVHGLLNAANTQGCVPTTGIYAASVTMTAGSSVYHLVTDAAHPADAAVAAQQALNATSAHDWTTLYNMLATEAQANYTQAQFVQMMNGQAGGTVVSATLNGPCAVVTTSLGVTYCGQPVTVVFQGTPNTTLNTNIYLIRENGAWRFLSTGNNLPQI